MLDRFFLQIRRHETPFFDLLFRMAKGLRRFEIPAFAPFYRILLCERSLRLAFWRNFTRIFYYTPLFKLQCNQIGRNPYLIGGSPLIMGYLKLNIGNNLTMHGVSTLIGAKVFDNPTLRIGNNTYLGYQLIINVGRDITIGDNVMVADRVSILSYDSHPTNPAQRHLPAPPESSKPIVIENNVWIGANCTILKGVVIGEGAVIGTGSLVTGRVPPNTLAIGNPARLFPLVR
jgi:acetyltransferase-like isoleucine patch superfamily enzyme